MHATTRSTTNRAPSGRTRFGTIGRCLRRPHFPTSNTSQVWRSDLDDDLEAAELLVSDCLESYAGIKRHFANCENPRDQKTRAVRLSIAADHFSRMMTENTRNDNDSFAKVTDAAIKLSGTMGATNIRGVREWDGESTASDESLGSHLDSFYETVLALGDTVVEWQNGGTQTSKTFQKHVEDILRDPYSTFTTQKATHDPLLWSCMKSVISPGRKSTSNDPPNSFHRKSRPTRTGILNNAPWSRIGRSVHCDARTRDICPQPRCWRYC